MTTWIIICLVIALVGECAWWLLNKVYSMGYDTGLADREMLDESEDTAP